MAEYSGYRISITNFEGPLDMLLEIIKANKLDIKTVRLAQVTQQYLDYMEQISQVDMDLASEFIEVAAVLLEIKSKNVLPKLDKNIESADDLEKRLLRQLEEYKLFKEASEKLGAKENVERFYKEPAKIKTDYKYLMDGCKLDNLLEAFAQLLAKAEIEAEPVKTKEIHKDRFTVADKINEITTLIKKRKRVSFFKLFDGDYTKSEIINTFLAVLELLKNQIIKASQNKKFSDIIIEKGEGNGEESA